LNRFHILEGGCSTRSSQLSGCWGYFVGDARKHEGYECESDAVGRGGGEGVEDLGSFVFGGGWVFGLFVREDILFERSPECGGNYAICRILQSAFPFVSDNCKIATFWQ